MAGKVSAIVVTHGPLGSALIASARGVYGDVSGCHAVTNEKKSPQALRDELDMIVGAADPDEEFLVFADFFGGSCCHTCLGLEIEHANVKVITGVNLPMFLAFLYKRKELDFDVLPDELIARGKESIRVASASEE